MASDGQYLWIGTEKYLTKFNTITGEMEYFDTQTTELPGWEITSIVIDSLGNKWIGNWGGGLVKYDGNTRTLYL